MKRDLFVFAGQSNMMGASVLPPKRASKIKNSYEYKHNIRRLKRSEDFFVKAGYPCGEFSYVDLDAAYNSDMVNEKGESRLFGYTKNTYFCPAMSNLASESDKTVHSFDSFSEATAVNGVTLAPILSEEWEKLGGSCAYAHIAKGGVSIDYFFTDEMTSEYARRIEKYNYENKTEYNSMLSSARQMPGAAEYFFEKCRDFFLDAEVRFRGDDLRDKCFFWLQGESDTGLSESEYETKMDILWERLKNVGFTHFFCIRVDYFGSDGIAKIMRAQEHFTEKHSDAYMLTRAASFITHPMQSDEKWFVTAPDDEYKYCRDSFCGYPNHHINERGFSVIASHAVKNLYRVLIEKKSPILEDENVRALISPEKETKNV